MRTLLLIGGVFLAGATVALAQENVVNGVLLSDPAAAIDGRERTIEFTARDDGAARFSPDNIPIGESPAPQRLELELAASGEHAGLPIDVSVAQRASLGSDSNGDIDRAGRGSEVRIGRGLVQQDRDDGSSEPSVYMFVASDDEALTWRPGQRSEFGGSRNGGGFSLQDQVEIGDVSAGVTYERGNVQASIAYVEREISTTVGRESFSKDERFAGVTVTMRN